MARDARSIILRVLYDAESISDPNDVIRFCDGVSDERLKGLIAQIISRSLPTWREASISSRISLPRFQKIDWRLDLRSASESSSNLSVPTLLVDLEVLF